MEGTFGASGGPGAVVKPKDHQAERCVEPLGNFAIVSCFVVKFSASQGYAPSSMVVATAAIRRHKCRGHAHLQFSSLCCQ